MKLLLTLIFFSLASVASVAQSEIGEWHFTLATNEPKLNDETQLIIAVDLPEGWGLYSSDFSPGSIGPIPTEFDFATSSGYAVDQRIKAINPVVADDEGFGIHYSYFTSKAEFRQPIRLTGSVANIKGTIKGQLFNLHSGKIITFEKPIDFTIQLNTTSK